jgi:hypothetical protein
MCESGPCLKFQLLHAELCVDKKIEASIFGAGNQLEFKDVIIHHLTH